jgi:hypothetical protein
MPIPEDECVCVAPRARRQVIEWLPAGDDQPVYDECMIAFCWRQIVWDEPPGG